MKQRVIHRFAALFGRLDKDTQVRARFSLTYKFI